MPEIYSEEEKKELAQWLAGALSSCIHTDISHMSVSEWAEKKRILPEGITSLPGPFSWDVCPYMKEIADCMSVTSPVQEIYVMKGAQICYTVATLENFLGYIIDCEPGPSMLVSGDQGMAGASMELRIDRMLQSSGLAGKIFSQSESQKSRKTGDTKDRKEFPGGFLMAVGPNSAAKLRTFSIRYLLLDEIDAYPQSTEGEGDPVKLLMRRTDSFEAIRKVVGGSTPTVAQSSKIYALYQQGDQRKYFVPCPKCGEMQALDWHRLKWQTDDRGRLIYNSVHYECCKCGAPWKNTDKAYFLPRGEWRSTAESMRPNMRSYHISSMYSPIGMRSWESAVEEFIDAQTDPAKLRVFVNTFLGEPFVERGEAPQYERIMLRREEYNAELRVFDKDIGRTRLADAEEVHGSLLVTIGADVQKDRIEAEAVAWGKDKESWSLGYHAFYGDPTKADDQVWDDFQTWVQQKHAGRIAALTLINSSYSSPSVYAFCDRFGGRGVLPVQGANRMVRNVATVEPAKGHRTLLVTLNVDQLKQEVYGYLQTPQPVDGSLPYPPGYCHFPASYKEPYFKMLTAEERTAEKDRHGYTRYIWRKVRDRNEALDCRVYALGAVDVLAQGAGGSVSKDGLIDWPTFWEYLRK